MHPRDFLRDAARSWRELGSGLGELFFEARCVLCDAPSGTATPWLCAAHDLEEQRLLRPTCPLCAMPAAESDAPCGSCAATARPWSALVAALAYGGAGRELLLQAKLGHRSASLRPLAEELGGELGRHAWARGARFVPVPLHAAKRRARGFNQAELIARELAERCGGRVCGVLRRVRATAPQGDPLTRDRSANVARAFALRRFARVPASVVLVDDTCTSMATLEACAQVLRRAGCRELRAAVVFRAGAPAACPLAAEHRVP
ncbi:MAG: ComF family protein [Planctomycetes bacterium]|nr:ComF family protein [Planctomycetota bacterium]